MTSGSDSDYMEFYTKKIKQVNDANYQIIVGFVDIPMEVAKARNLERVKKTGRFISDDAIEAKGTKNGDFFCKLINDNNSNVIKFAWIDNSGAKPEILIEGNPSNEDDVEQVKKLCLEKGYSYTID